MSKRRDKFRKRRGRVIAYGMAGRKAPALSAWTRVLPLVAVVAGALAYATSFRGPFFFDDLFTVSDNFHLRDPSVMFATLKSAFAPPQSPLTNRPLTALTFVLNYRWGELNVVGYHVVNLGIHLANSVVLWALVRRTLLTRNVPERLANAAPYVATVVALLWTAHPLSTESVVYITQRTTLLKSFFWLLMLYAANRAWGSPRQAWWSAAAIGCCALGMASKETMVGAPFIVALYDGVFLASSWREAWQRRWPLYAGLAANWLLLALLIAWGPHNPTVGFDLSMLTPWQYLMTQSHAILHYLRLSIWPRPLVVTYDWKAVTSLRDALLPGLVILGLLAGTVAGLVRRRWWGFLGAWFFIVLAPTSSILPIVTEMLAERRMYLPLVAPVVFVVIGAWRALTWFPFHPRVSAGLAIGLTTIVTGAAISTVYHRVIDFRDEHTIWMDTVAKSPRSDLAYNNLARCHYVAGDRQRAMELYEYILTQLNPNSSHARASLGAAYYDAGRYAEAEAELRIALRLNPRLAHIRSNLALVLVELGQFDEAHQVSQEELAIAPGFSNSWNTLGIVYARQRQYPAARAAFIEARRRDRSDVRSYRNYCQTFLDEAIAPSGAVDAERLDVAIDHFQRFTVEHPQDPDGRRRLAQAHTTAGNLVESLREWEVYLQLQPTDLQARDQTARLRALVDQQSRNLSTATAR